EAELRAEHRPDQGPRTGDRREVVAVEYPLIGGHVVAAVREPLGGRGAAVVEGEHARGDLLRIEAIADDVGADGRDEQPRGVDSLSAREGEYGEAERAQCGDRAPEEHRAESSHGGKLRLGLPGFKLEHRFEFLGTIFVDTGLAGGAGPRRGGGSARASRAAALRGGSVGRSGRRHGWGAR